MPKNNVASFFSGHGVHLINYQACQDVLNISWQSY